MQLISKLMLYCTELNARSRFMQVSYFEIIYWKQRHQLPKLRKFYFLGPSRSLKLGSKIFVVWITTRIVWPNGFCELVWYVWREVAHATRREVWTVYICHKRFTSEGVPANYIVATRKTVNCKPDWCNRIVVNLYLLKWRHYTCNKLRLHH